MTGRYKAAKYSQKFLGKGYYKAGQNRWVSSDGFRQVRWDVSHHLYDGVPSKAHFNLETFRNPIGGLIRPGKAIENIHVWIN